jgi:hypothetical protein
MPLNEAGDIAFISTPFQFDDGEPVPAFAEAAGGRLRFFDDGATMMHFLGRGLSLDDKRRLRFLTKAAELHGAVLNEAGEIEVWAHPDNASEAFAKYVSTLLSVTAWEHEQRDVTIDTALLVDEVAMALRAWRPDAPLDHEPPPLIGISGQEHRVDLWFGGEGVVATSPHPNAVGASLRKLVDIRSSPSNEGLKFLVVIDDRADPGGAAREARVLQAVATVMPMSALEQRGRSARPSLHGLQ